MKTVKYLVILITLSFLLIFPASAIDDLDSADIIDDYSGEIFESLDEDTLNILSEMGLDEIEASSMLDLSPVKIITVLKNEFTFQAKENISFFFKALGILLALVILNSVRKKSDFDLTDDIFAMTVILLVSVTLSDTVKMLVAVLKLTEKFMLALIPVITVILSFSGNVTFSAVYSTMMVGFCQVISAVADNFIIPLTGVYFGIITAMNLNEITDADKISSAVCKACGAVLGTVSTVFSLLLSAKNLLSKDIDGVVYKSGKYIISSFVPVVGNAVSGILGSIIGSLSIAKSTMGIFAVIAAVCINIPLFIKIIFCRTTFFFLALISDSFGEKKAAGFIRSLSKSMRILMILAFFVLITVIISTGLAVSIRGNIQ